MFEGSFARTRLRCNSTTDFVLTETHTHTAAEQGILTQLLEGFGSISTKIDNLQVKQINSTLRPTDTLRFVKKANGQLLAAADYPPTIRHLVVSGTENLRPGQRNTWNMEKGKRLIRELDPDDLSGGESDDEDSDRAQSYRGRVASLLGVTRQQLQAAASLNF
jgi:hypothetical protein